MVRKRKSRREYGSGSILRNTKLNRYTVRWYDADGKHRSCSTFPLTPDGKRSAERFLATMNAVEQHPMSTLGDWVLEVIKIKKSKGRASSHNQRKYAASQIPENLLNMQITEIKPYQVMNAYQMLYEHKHAVSTIKKIHVLFNAAFRLAKTNGAISVNIMPDVTTPENATKTPVTVMSWRELGKVFLHLQHRTHQHRNYVLLFRLLYGLGCRIGELQALRWSDINWQTREIHIQRTVSGENGRAVEPPKTAAGDRLVPILSNHTWKMLVDAYEAAGDHNGYVFAARRTNNPILYGTIHRIWRNCGIHKKIHCFRHTRASHLIAAGFPIAEVSRILGHSSTAITMSVYTHSLPNGNELIRKLYQQSISTR